MPSLWHSTSLVHFAGDPKLRPERLAELIGFIPSQRPEDPQPLIRSNQHIIRGKTTSVQCSCLIMPLIVTCLNCANKEKGAILVMFVVASGFVPGGEGDTRAIVAMPCLMKCAHVQYGTTVHHLSSLGTEKCIFKGHGPKWHLLTTAHAFNS